MAANKAFLSSRVLAALIAAQGSSLVISEDLVTGEEGINATWNPDKRRMVSYKSAPVDFIVIYI
jgi:hypothetical protein